MGMVAARDCTEARTAGCVIRNQRSTSIAMPMPPPMHIEIRPVA